MIEHLHQYTATKSFSLRSRSSCLAVTSSITGSVSFCLPAEPRDEVDSSAFVLVAASTWPRRTEINASTLRRMMVLGWYIVVGIVGPRIVVLRLLLRQHHHHRPNRTAEPSFAVDIAALTAAPSAIFEFSDSVSHTGRSVLETTKTMPMTMTTTATTTMIKMTSSRSIYLMFHCSFSIATFHNGAIFYLIFSFNFNFNFLFKGNRTLLFRSWYKGEVTCAQ